MKFVCSLCSSAFVGFFTVQNADGDFCVLCTTFTIACLFAPLLCRRKIYTAIEVKRSQNALLSHYKQQKQQRNFYMSFGSVFSFLFFLSLIRTDGVTSFIDESGKNKCSERKREEIVLNRVTMTIHKSVVTATY